jgi:HEAT repeat protein
MTEEEKTSPEQSAPPEPELDDDLDFGRTVLQFFVVPAIVVAACVGLFLFFAWLVSDEKTGVDYLNEIRAGSENRRWQAAFELSKIITMESEKERMGELVPEMIAAFEQAEGDDERVRHYLALTLGHLGDPMAAPSLIEALGDDDPATRLYAAWALGNIGDTRAVPALIERAGDDDPGVRKMAVYALGAIGDENAIPRLQVALADPVRDVSWNAAVALAQLGDSSGESQLLRMLDHEFLAGVTEMDEAQRLLATESAIKASALLSSETLSAQLRVVADDHPNVAIRQAALAALQEQKTEKLPDP